MRGWLIGLGLLGASGCASSPAPAMRPTRLSPSAPTGSAARPTSLDDILAQDMAPEHAMPWSAGRRLVWSDFKAKPPTGGAEGARTAHGIYYAWSCRGDAFAFRARAAFLPFRSWVKPVVLRDAAESVRVLRHEQAHFDLSEVYARRARQRFAELRAPCAMKDAELSALARRLVEEEKAAQRRYDAESEHSLATARQAAWEADVAAWLAALARFAH